MLPTATWTSGPPDVSACCGLHETVAEIACQYPDRTALVDLAESAAGLSYRTLNRTADAWASALVQAGVGPGDVVPIVDTRGARLVVSLLAVLKTGAAYALLDPAWPAERLEHIVVEQLHAPLVVSPHAVAVPVRRWTPPSGERTAAPADFHPLAVRPDAPCCVFFTSGTTGAPKGVLTSHRAVSRLFQRNSFGRFDENTVMPLAAPAPWDAFAMELWAPLLNGGTSLILDERYLTAASLRRAVALHGANTVWLTSSLLNLIVDEDIAAFRGVRQLLTGGERLSPTHVRRLVFAHPDLAVLNGYGPVENCVFATTHLITHADLDEPGGIPLGTPVPGTGVHVLDGERPCAVGEVGEVCLTGTGLALGYLGSSGGFGAVVLDGSRQRAYRTGDRGSWAADGTLRYHGRADRQLKVRGHRVEPAEVERQIERSTRVRAATVLPRHDSDGQVVDLVACCVPSTPGDTLTGLAEELAAGLVAHHRPAILHSVAEFPLTAQGKLDEGALRALLPKTRCRGAGTPLGALNSTQRQVVDVVAAVLDVPAEHVDLKRSLFAQGLSSLDAGRVCARLGAERRRAVPIAGLYDDPTVGALATLLDSANLAPLVAPDPAAAEVPLSPMQLVFLTRDLVDPDNKTGHCLLSWLLEGDVDRDALQSAVDEVHWRHEPLSARYLIDPVPVACLDDVPPPAVTVLETRPDLAAAECALRAELGAPLELAKGEVWRVVLAPVRSRNGTNDLPARSMLGCAVHHVAFDGFSESVLACHLSISYAAARSHDQEVLATLPAPVALDAGHAVPVPAPAVVDRVVAELRGVPDLHWPTEGSDQAGTRPERLTISVPPQAIVGLERYAEAHGHSRFTALFAQWAAALGQVTGQYDFAVGVPVSQRSDPRLAHAIGCHLNTVPVRLRDKATRGDVDAVAQAAAKAFAGQEVPLSDVLGSLHHNRTHRPPLFQIMFALQDNPAPDLVLSGVDARFVRQPYLDLPLEMHTEIWPQPDGSLHVEIATRPDAVPATAVADLAACFSERLSDLKGATG